METSKYINKINYLKFEHYCINKHNIDYNHITYHWSIIPDKVLIDSGYFESEDELREKRKKCKGLLREYGLDGISCEIIENENNIYHGIQVKLWNNTICANDLGTFTSVIINRFSDKSKGYLYHTSHLEKTFENDIKKKNKFISIKIDNPYINENNNLIKDNNQNIILRPYQIEAIEKLKTNWNGIKILNLPCGTGKTIIFSKYLQKSTYKNIFIFSPLIILTEQNLDRVKKFLPHYNSMLIDYNNVRNFHEIKNTLHKNYIYSSTFKSAELIVSKIFNDNHNINSSNTILIVDEAHNLLNLTTLINIINKFPKVLLVTATLPLQMDEIITSDILYTYSFKKAIENGYICDYEIFLPYSENREINIHQPNELYHLDKDICKKCLFFINGLLRTGKRKSIVYLKSKEECDIYKYVLEEIMDKYHFYNIIVYKIISDTKKKERNEILENFEKDEDYEVIKVILSIRILDEGVDIIKCDSIFLTYIGDINNDIRNLQRICRANRLDSNNLNKKASIFIWSEDENKMINTLQMLKINDVNLNKKIRINNNNYGTYKKKIEKEVNLDEYINNDLFDFININCLTEDEIWENKKNLLFEFCNEHNRCIEEHEIYKNNKIGYWYKAQKNKIINNFELHKNLYEKLIENIYVKNNLDINNNTNNYTSYICKKCSFRTTHYNDLFRHLNKKKTCLKNLDSYNYSDDQILILTLLPYYEGIHTVNEKDIDYLKDSDILSSNSKELFEIINNIEKNKLKKCNYCNEEFTKINDYKKHIILTCFYKELKKRNKKDDINKPNLNSINGNNNTNNNLSTINNNQCTTNINNITNIYFELKNPIPFDEEWDISMIDKKIQSSFLISKFMYTGLLEEILKNEINLNVIIDKNNNSGIVYKNDIDKYIKMKTNDIVDNTMIKLKKHLLDINKNCKELCLDECLDYSRKIIEKKNIDYQNNININNSVKDCISNIFEKKKQDAIKISNNIKNTEEYELNKGF